MGSVVKKRRKRMAKKKPKKLLKKTRIPRRKQLVIFRHLLRARMMRALELPCSLHQTFLIG